MEVKPALAIPEGLEVTGIEMIDEVLTITAVSTQIQPCCPLCGTPAMRVHSRYTRQIRDLPVSRATSLSPGASTQVLLQGA
jgi:hypothetical protein